MKLWRNQPDHDNWRKPFSNREKAGVYLGFSAMFATLIFSEWRSPKIPPFSGRYSWLFSSLYQLNNSFGILSIYILFATVLLVLGTFKWFEK